MKASGAVLDDSASADWEEGYRGEIHASVLLAHDDESELNREARRILQEVRQFADVVAGERGKAMRNKNCETVEHFGYVDGRSQPLFLKEDIDKEREKEPGTVLYDPSAPVDLVLVPDPNGDGNLSFGSYFVFRKLEQDVLGFKKAEEQLADELGLKGPDEELAGAMVVGRFEDGTPVVLQKTDGQTDPVPNNFNYKADPSGLRCPFHAHIRKVNPRGDTTRLGELEERERRHRIARRGITYGERCKEPKDNPAMEDLPSKDVGLLFMCFQSNIENQFEFIQKQWANNEDFLLRKTGIDPVIGQHQKNQNPMEQSWPAVWGRSVKRPFSFHGFVTLKGGEYFFAPSLSALKKI